MTDISLADIDVLYEAPPVPPRGAPSKWPSLVDLARQVAEDAAKKKPPVRAEDGGSPWIAWPKADENGKREPIVASSTLSNLRKQFGPDSDHAKENGGEFFEFELVDRVVTGEKKSSFKGVLWLRRGTRKK